MKYSLLCVSLTLLIVMDAQDIDKYAIGTIAAAAFAAVLYSVVTGDSVLSGLTALVQRALSVSF